MTVSARGSGAGFDLALELDSTDLLPGRLVDGRLRISSRDGGAIRGARVTLTGTETWRYDQTTTDAKGQVHTETHTASQDLPKVPVAVMGATQIGAGAQHDIAFQVPVPALGPATFDATELGVDWSLGANLDVAGFDPGVVLPVRHPAADGAAAGGRRRRGAVRAVRRGRRGRRRPARIDPPRTGPAVRRGAVPRHADDAGRRVTTGAGGPARTARHGPVDGGRRSIGDDHAVGRSAGRMPASTAARRPPRMPSASSSRPGPADDRTAHGRADAAFHLVVAIAWARDPHLVRDVAICSTTEI